MFGRKRRRLAAEREQHLAEVMVYQAEVLAMVRRDVQNVRQSTAGMAGVLSNLEHATAATAQRITDLGTACRFVEVLSPPVRAAHPLEFP